MNIQHVTNLNAKELAPYVSLSNRELKNIAHPGDSFVICESLLVLQTVFELHVEVVSVLVWDKHLSNLERSISPEAFGDVPIYVASHELLSKLVGFNVCRGYYACVRRPSLLSSASVDWHSYMRIAVVEDLCDVSNLGALIRNACALGIDAVVCSPTCADPFNRRCVRTSMGTVFRLPIIQAHSTWPYDVFSCLSAADYTVFGAALRKDALNVHDVDFSHYKRCALCFGNESKGLSTPVIDACDQLVMIPMKHGVDSLNVAASSAVLFWDMCS